MKFFSCLLSIGVVLNGICVSTTYADESVTRNCFHADLNSENTRNEETPVVSLLFFMQEFIFCLFHVSGLHGFVCLFLLSLIFQMLPFLVSHIDGFWVVY